jgi:rfaE bifunctional protein kinase chain/domain
MTTFPIDTPLIALAEAEGLEGCVLTYGHFSTIHPGHIRYLKHASKQGDRLVVALVGDGVDNQSNRYQFSQQERADGLALLPMVDAVVLLADDELPQVVGKLQPSVLVLGKEFERSLNPPIVKAIADMRSVGKAVQFHAGDINYASADLLSSSESELIDQRRNQYRLACKRQGLTFDNLLNSIQAWRKCNLIVFGDTIVDQYAACEALGMSAEAPVVVVRELQKRNFIGGAAVVASHIRALGAQCQLLSVVGTDSTAELVRRELAEREIGDGLVNDPSRPTTFKKRYMVENQKLFRVSRLEDHGLDSEVEAQLIKKLEQLAPAANGIVVSDFVYGVVTNRLLELISDLATRHGLMLFGDLQCSSQVGSVTRFKNFSLLCPNEREARVALQDKDTGLELLSQELIAITACERLVMKLGADGFIAYDRNEAGELKSQPFPALCANPLDVTGAGDSLLAVMATGLASCQGMMQTAALACCMSALAVETMGNTPISADRLRQQLEILLSS